MSFNKFIVENMLTKNDFDNINFLLKRTKEAKVFKKDDSKKKFIYFTQGIEDQLEKVFIKKKEEIEKILEERIKLLKEESEKKIENNKDEIYQEKKEAKHYMALISELEDKAEEARNTIQVHTRQADEYKKEIWKLTEMQNKELWQTMELNKQLDKLHQEAAEKSKALKNQLEIKYGIEAKFPDINVLKEKAKVDVSQEMEKIGKIRELLGPTEFSLPQESAEEKEPSLQPLEKSDLEAAIA